MDLLNIINIILSVIASAFSIVISFLAVKNANKTGKNGDAVRFRKRRPGGANKAAKPKAPETLYGVPSACFQHFAE